MRSYSIKLTNSESIREILDQLKLDIEMLSKALSKLREIGVISNFLGYKCGKEGFNDIENRLYINAVTIFHACAKLYNQRGCAYYHLDDFENAYLDFKAATVFDSNYMVAHDNLTLVSRKLGRETHTPTVQRQTEATELESPRPFNP